MSEETEIQPLAPPWLPRQQRRHLDRILNKLVEREACSICGSDWKHNSRTAYGLDRNGKIVAAGECCLDQIAITSGRGFLSERRYDFLNQPHGHEPGTSAREPSAPSASPACKPARVPETWEQIDKAIGLYQNAIAAADKQLEGIEHGGVERHGDVKVTGEALLLLDYPWKTDDRVWCEENPQRSHRARMPFAGEDYLFVTKALPGCSPIVLVRQIKPGTRMRRGFDLNTVLLPVPDDEALIHAMFEIADRREPAPTTMQAFCALRDKYAARGSC
jgi:hypothetical protein